MPLSPAEKQRAYRERKKRDEFLSNAYSVTKVMQDARVLGVEQEMSDLIGDLWDIGGPVTIPESWKLALKVADHTGEIYPHLVKAEKREFLRAIFFKQGIRVTSGGGISKVDVLPGFALSEG
jgi:hypothetical protein